MTKYHLDSFLLSSWKFFLSRQDVACSSFSCQTVQKFSWIFFQDFAKFCEILRNLPRIIAKILVRNLKNSSIFLARQPKCAALGTDIIMRQLGLFMAYQFISSHANLFEQVNVLNPNNGCHFGLKTVPN